MHLDTSEIAERHTGALCSIVDAIADGEGVLLVGPPGVGKTMIARRIPTFLPELTELGRAWIAAEHASINLMPRYTSTLTGEPLPVARPFRAPHHTVSDKALIGGNATGHTVACPAVRSIVAGGRCKCTRELVSRPGELQLARFGVLMLDELADFRSSALFELGLAMRHMGASRPIIVATVNPCPCGWFGSGVRDCSCTAGALMRHNARIASALHALRVPMRRVPVETLQLADLRDAPRAPASVVYRARLDAAIAARSEVA